MQPKHVGLTQIKAWLRDVPERKPEVIPKCTNSTKKILWFDVWHNGAGVRNKCKHVDFSKCECPCDVDFFLFNDTQKVYDPFGGDAVVFQINKIGKLGHPPVKHEGQVFVAVEREATPLVRIPLQNFEYVFNWTMSFRQDSDIFYPYGRIMRRTGDTTNEGLFSHLQKEEKRNCLVREPLQNQV